MANASKDADAGGVSSATRRDVIRALAGASAISGIIHSAAGLDGLPIARVPGAQQVSATQLWPLWRAARRKTVEACSKQQRLEKELVRLVGFPEATMSIPDAGSSLTNRGAGANERLLDENPDHPDEVQSAADAPNERSLLWNDADRALGYSAARDQEDAALLEAAKLSEQLLASRALSITDIVAKLDVLIALDPWEHGGYESPWPELRQMREELMAMALMVYYGAPLG